MEDTYKPRFKNDLVAEQYKAIGQVNIPKNLVTNGGDEPSGDASTCKDEVHGTNGNTSPTYTRDELSALIARKMCDYEYRYSYSTDCMADAAIDALIAIGAVRVK